MLPEPPNIPLFEVIYFPPVSFFAVAYNFPVVLIEQYENYQKRGLRSKCNILASGGIETLSIPLQKGKNQQKPITEVRISYDLPWRRQHLNSLQTAYGKSAYYIHYIDKIKAVFDKDYEFVFELDVALINLFFELLRLDTVLGYTEEYKPVQEKYIWDLRNRLNNIDSNRLITEEGVYPQTFSDRHGFVSGLSILDLLFCMGPESVRVLQKMKLNMII